MKVLHLISGGDSGGAKTHVHSLLVGLSKEIQVEMVCFADGPFVREARELGIHVDVMGGSNLMATLKQLKARIAQQGYDIIHCHGAKGNLMGAMLYRSTGIPVVTTVHSDPRLDYMGRAVARLTFGTLNQWALRQIPYHIGVSDAMVDKLIDRGIVKHSFFSIYNGIEFTPVPPVGDRLAYLRELGMNVDEDSVVVGIAARMNPVKDLSTLVRGFALAHAKCPRLRLVIAGDGEERELLENLTRELGMEPYITFAGWISGGMDRFYAALDINTLTSLSETFPYALTEGARFHLATVATAVGGIPNLIENGVNGFLFTPGDCEALGRHLALLGNDDQLRRSCGEHMYEIASTRFSLSKTIQTQLDIYRRILEDVQRPKDQRRGVVICGAYGRGNAGDEAILRAIVTELRTLDPQLPICVMTRKPRQARRDYRVEATYIFNVLSYPGKLRRCRLYINGGGSLIQDVTSRRSLWFYLHTLEAAKARECKVMMYGCGIGPVLHNNERKMAQRIIDRDVDVITLRDQDSLEELRALGVTKPRIVLAADPTVTLPPALPEASLALLREAGLKPEEGQRYLGVTVRPWPGFEACCGAIAEAVEHAYRTHGLIPVFIPIEPRLDGGAAVQVAGHLKDTPYVILPGCSQPEQSIALFSQMDAVLSMRLHALIFSAVRGVPLVGIVYDPKVSAFLDAVGQDLYTPMPEVTADKLSRLLDEAVIRGKDRELLAEKTSRLLELEKNNLICARELLEL